MLRSRVQFVRNHRGATLRNNKAPFFSRRPGFTLVELLVVIAMIGILVSLLLPAVQSAREAARRTQCASNMMQIALGLMEYQAAYEVYPSGVLEPKGPIQNIPVGYHHGWLTQILPFLEQENLEQHIDRSVGVYHKNNADAAGALPYTFRCPSTSLSKNSNYAAVHHDVEAPIDVSNQGVFFLNSTITPKQIPDGRGATLFLSEISDVDPDLNWMSGTRASLRNFGRRIKAYDLRLLAKGSVQSMNNSNAASLIVAPVAAQSENAVIPSDESVKNSDKNDGTGAGSNGNSEQAAQDGQAVTPPLDGSMEDGEKAPSADSESAQTADNADPSAANLSTTEREEAVIMPPEMDEELRADYALSGSFDVVNANEGYRPRNPLYVGGFSSNHIHGVNVVYGDGRIDFISSGADVTVLQKLANRGDGALVKTGK